MDIVYSDEIPKGRSFIVKGILVIGTKIENQVNAVKEKIG